MSYRWLTKCSALIEITDDHPKDRESIMTIPRCAESDRKRNLDPITPRALLAYSDFVSRNEHAKEWFVSAIVMAISIAVFAVSFFLRTKLPWIVDHWNLLITIIRALSGPTALYTMFRMVIYFSLRLKAAGIIDRKRKDIPDYINIARSSNGTFWAIDLRSGRAFPLRTDGSFESLPPAGLDQPLV